MVPVGKANAKREQAPPKVSKYTWLELQAAEVLTDIHCVSKREAAANMKRAQAQYAEEIANPSENQWAFNKAGKPLTFKQWRKQFFMDYFAGWWWYIELNDEEAPAGGPYPTREAAMRAGVKKYGRNAGPTSALHEVSYNLLFTPWHYLGDLLNLGVGCYDEKRQKVVNRRQAEKLAQRWQAMVLAEQWAALKAEWGFACDKRMLKLVRNREKVTAKYLELHAANTAKLNSYTLVECKAAVRAEKIKYKWRDGQCWVNRPGYGSWREYTYANEAELVRGMVASESLLGVKSDFKLREEACDSTGVTWGMLPYAHELTAA